MKQFFNSAAVQTIITILVAFIVINLGQALGSPMLLFGMLVNSEVITFLGMYASFIGIWILIFIIWGIFKKYRCLFGILGPKAKGNSVGKSLLLGLIFGLGTNLLVACIAMICGDIKLEFNEFNIGYVLLFLAAVFIQSGAEEIVMRGHVYQNFRRIFPKYPIVAILGNALLFALMHANNPGVTVLALINIFISGIMMSLIVFYFDSFWGAVFVHTGWNYCQSIILGLPNSGNVSMYSIFKLDAATARNSFAYNVNFGIESSVASVIVLILACVIIILIGRKRNQKPFDPWATEEAKAFTAEMVIQPETAVLSGMTSNAETEDQATVSEINNEQEETEK